MAFHYLVIKPDPIFFWDFDKNFGSEGSKVTDQRQVTEDSLIQSDVVRQDARRAPIANVYVC